MMLVPQFKLSQSQQFVIVVLRLPYVKISTCQFHIQQHNFKFYLKPYLLSLTFQQSLQQAQQPSKAIYYHEKYLLQIHLKKKNKGQNFNNLNLLSNVLNTKKNKEKNCKKVLVQVIGGNQQIIKNNQQEICANPYGYGFCNNYDNVFNGLQEQSSQIFSLNPKQVKKDDRFEFSVKIAESNFDQDAFLFDKYQNTQQINQLLKSKEPQHTLSQLLKKYKSKQPQTYQQFKSQLKIPNKQIIVNTMEQQNITKQLFSIYFAYIYELVCMEGDMSVQSAKTINNTAAVFNCCVSYHNVQKKDVAIDCFKRSVIYSLYKSVQIGQHALKIGLKNLSQDMLCAILLDLRRMFNKSQPRHLLNTIYIDDFLIYCTKSKIDNQLSNIKTDLQKIKLAQQQLKHMFDEQNSQDSQDNQQEQIVPDMKKQKQLIQVIDQTQNQQTQEQKIKSNIQIPK